jgi:hypothetical protein
MNMRLLKIPTFSFHRSEARPRRTTQNTPVQNIDYCKNTRQKADEALARANVMNNRVIV